MHVVLVVVYLANAVSVVGLLSLILYRSATSNHSRQSFVVASGLWATLSDGCSFVRRLAGLTVLPDRSLMDLVVLVVSV